MSQLLPLQQNENALNVRSLTPQQVESGILKIWQNNDKPQYKVITLTQQQVITLVSYYIYTAQDKTSLSACKKITANDVYSAFWDCYMNY